MLAVGLKHCVSRNVPVCTRAIAQRRAISSMALKKGDAIPSFEVETDASTAAKKVTIKSSDMVKDNGAVIFVYPKACTSGCTFQANEFKNNQSAFEKLGYKIYGMSADEPAAQAGWSAEHQLPYPLLCDPSKQVLEKMGVIGDGGSIKRSHFIIAKGGKVVDAVIGVSSKDSHILALESAQKL